MTIILICLVAILLFGCSGEVTAMSVKEEEFYLAIGKKLDLRSCLDVEGKGKIEYVVETPDILALEKNSVIGLAEGVGTVSAFSGSLICRIDINVYDGSLIRAGISDATYDYDGSVKNLVISGNIPEDASAVLYHNGVVFEGATLPGVYNLRLEIEAPDGYRVRYTNQTAVLTIRKLKIDLSGLKFESKTYTYDGAEKSVLLEGEIPKEVAVSYENNVATDAGTYRARAVFRYDDKIYEQIYPMNATLTINRAPFNVDYGTFGNYSYYYDGNEHIPQLGTLPQGLGAEITVYDSRQQNALNPFVPIEKYREGRDVCFTDAGRYRFRATFIPQSGYERNYIVPAELTVTITVVKARPEINAVWVKTGHVTEEGAYGYGNFVYSGNPYTVGTEEGRNLRLTGSAPTGVKGEFAGRITMTAALGDGTSDSVTNAGSYTAYAKFAFRDEATRAEWEKNYEPLNDIPYRFVVERKQYEAEFTFGATDGNAASTWAFDGERHFFGLIFPKGEGNFYNDIDVKYYVQIDGGAAQERNTEELYALNAGRYVFSYELAFKDDLHKTNYRLPVGEVASVTVTVTPYAVEMYAPGKDISGNDVRLETALKAEGFSSRTVEGITEYVGTYTGEPVVFVVENLPEPFTVGAYEGRVTATIACFQGGRTVESIVNAGEYYVRATLRCEGIAVGNCVFLKNGAQVTEFAGNVTVQKGRYSPSVVGGYGFYAESADGNYTYDPEKRLADFEIKSAAGREQYIRWENPNAVPDCGHQSYSAVYNDDPDNCENYVFGISLSLDKARLDAAQLGFVSQFVPLVGGELSPLMTYVGKESDLFTAIIENTPPYSYGALTVTRAEAALRDETNYEFVNGSAVFENVVIYVYDPTKYTYNGMTLVACLDLAEEIEIPEGTEAIYNNAFVKSVAMKKLTLPDSVKNLSVAALGSAYALEELDIPFTGADYANPGALKGIFGTQMPASLKKITVRNMTYIPDMCFDGCGSIEEISYLLNVESVGTQAFDGCASLKKVNFGGREYDGADLTGATEIGRSVFHGCFALEKLKVPFVGELGTLGSVSNLIGEDRGDNGYGNYKLQLLDLSECAFDSIPQNEFSNLRITTLVLPKMDFAVQSGGFSGMFAELVYADGTYYAPSVLTAGIYKGYRGSAARFSQTVTAIPDEAFYDAQFLSEIVLPSTVTSIGKNAFYNVKKVRFENSSMTALGEKAFFGYAGDSLTLPETLTEIGSSAFENSALINIRIGNGVSKVGDRAFYNCRNLKVADVYAAEIGSSAFGNCNNLSKVTLGNTVKIGDGAFAGCPFAEIDFPATLAEIGSSAFGSDINIVRFRGATPPKVSSDSFSHAENGIRFYAPAANVEDYNSAFRAVLSNVVEFRAL